MKRGRSPLLVVFCLLAALSARAAALAQGGPSATGTSGPCSPAISGVGGNVTINIVCVSSRDELRDTVLRNLEIAVRSTAALSGLQSSYLVPTVWAFVDNPSEENWNAVLYQIQSTQRLLTAATESVLMYDASLEVDGLGPNLRELHDTLRSRASLLAWVPSNPPSSEAAVEWLESYRVQMSRLTREISALRERLRNCRQAGQGC